MLRHGVEPLVHRALQLGLRLGKQLAHRLHPGAQLDDTLVGELGHGGLFGRKLRRQRVGLGRPLPSDKDGKSGNGQAHDQAKGDEDGGFHDVFLRDSLRPDGGAKFGAGFSTGTNREHIDRPKSSP